MALVRVEGPASSVALGDPATLESWSGRTWEAPRPLVIDLRTPAAEVVVAPEAATPPGVARRAITRAFDLTIAVPALVLSLPLMLAVAGVIAVGSPGPVLHRSPRLTKHGNVFHMWKFRSMVTNGDEVLAAHFRANPRRREDYERDRKLADDPRVTRVGRVIRRLSIDELPQLVNVVRGHMSIVGPRPMMPAEAERFGSAFSVVTMVKSGITGTWQVSGRSSLTFAERVVFDVRCATEASLRRDISVVARTAWQLIRRRTDAY